MNPSTIAHYTILEKLGEGGMGVVYKAHDFKLDRIVALKMLTHATGANQGDQARFLHEAKAASALNHPNVCGIHSIGEVDGESYIDMEFVEGRTLRAVIAAGPVNTQDIVSFTIQIAEALQEAHARGLLHRDITCDNIMVTPKNRIKVMDFGIATLKGANQLTRTKSSAGTLAFMAPEVLQGSEVDHRADLWGLGVVLYQMLTGTLPFRGEHEAAIMYEILNAEPRAISASQPEVPVHLNDLVAQLLQKVPSRRIASATEVIERLQKPQEASPGLPEIKSIAVLYFENMSPEKESDYFCAGITEDIITDLSKIRELNVVSRADILPLRDKAINTRQVGEMLKVKYVVEGSVRKAGNRMRISAQLVDVRTGFHVWADRFDRLTDDVLDLQTEVSQKIVDALKVSVSDSEKKSLAQRPTDDLRAYDFYMRGRDFVYRRGSKNTALAIQMFENALLIDPQFAAAYAGLSEAYSYVYSWYDGDPQWLGKIIAMSEKALSLDPGSEDAQLAIGMVYFHQKRPAEAKRTLEKVVRKNPNHYDSHRWLGIIASISGEHDAALRLYKRSAELKPYSEEPWMHLELTYRQMGDPAGAAEAARRLLEVGERKVAVNPDDAIALSRMAGTYVRVGKIEQARTVLKRTLDIAATDGLAQYNCACAYANLGEKKSAIACLRNAVESGYRVGDWIKNDPDMDSLRDEPEYRELLARIG